MINFLEKVLKARITQRDATIILAFRSKADCHEFIDKLACLFDDSHANHINQINACAECRAESDANSL